jgi:hypothetical protein
MGNGMLFPQKITLTAVANAVRAGGKGEINLFEGTILVFIRIVKNQN